MRRHLRYLLAFGGLLGAGLLVWTPHAASASSVIDTTNATVFAPAVATGVDGHNVISYVNGLNEVRLAHCSNERARRPASRSSRESAISPT